jgi:hypothetical protein
MTFTPDSSISAHPSRINAGGSVTASFNLGFAGGDKPDAVDIVYSIDSTVTSFKESGSGSLTRLHPLGPLNFDDAPVAFSGPAGDVFVLSITCMTDNDSLAMSPPLGITVENKAARMRTIAKKGTLAIRRHKNRKS